MKGKGFYLSLRRTILLCLFFLLSFKSYAQTDTEFWFVVPDVTYLHNTPGGEPAKFTFSTFSMASTVTVSMPGNSNFKDTVHTIPANSTWTLDVSDYINTSRTVTPVLSGKKPANVDMENIYNVTTPNKNGIKITSTTPITAYYQIANTNNTELYALKGRNALGQKFYVPFQNVRTNHQHNNPHPAYSSINIVATEDNTSVVITPSQDAYVLGNTVLKGTPKTIVLNKGEAIAVVPSLSGGQPGRTGANHLSGTSVTSDKNIAITTNDDSVDGWTSAGNASGNYDTIGDQLVNLSSLGLKYVVLKTQATSPDDDIYVTATEDGTVVTFKNNNGSVTSSVTLNAGDQTHISTVGSYCFIDATKKVSVLHVGGYGHELGGAILPAIDKCTGSTQVAFNKLASTGGKTFNTNIMVRTAGKNQFFLNGVAINLETFSGNTWTQIPGTDWWFLQVLNWRNAGVMTSLVENGGNILTNKGDLFHFGVFYGASSGGCNYGYFSDFNELVISGGVAGIEAEETKVCFGKPIQLYARGGTTYRWSPSEYLSDTTIFNPLATIPVQGTHQYNVIVSGACNMTDTVTINLQILPPLNAAFSVDKVEGCSPVTVEFKNTSTNAANLYWKFGDGTTATSDASDPNGLVETFTHEFVNNTNKDTIYTVQLMVKSAAGCGELVEKKIKVFPSVEAKIKRIDPTPQYCSPRTVQFENDSPTTALPASTILWDYGDGVSQNTADKTVTHEFSVLNQAKRTHDVTLTLMNSYGCKSVAKDTIDVYGKVDALFTLDKDKGCPNPTFDAELTDGSTGMIVSKNWTWDGFSNTKTSTTSPDVYDISASNRTTNAASVDVRTIKLDVIGNGGCTDSFQKDVTINPYVNANFSISDLSLCDGNQVNIINSSSKGSTSFMWEFGDGATSADANPTHTYTNPSDASVDYKVKLTASSAEGCSSTLELTTPVTVYSRIKPGFVINDQRGCAPLNATIVNTSKGNANNTFVWDFGDGSTLTENKFIQNRNHSFANTTTSNVDYSVNLTVTNEGGCFESTSRFAKVYAQPVADFNVDKSIGCNPLPVSLKATTNESKYVYDWSFDDETTGQGSTISHTYNNYDAVNKVFNPTLTVSTLYCTADASKPITVYPYLKAGFTLSQPSVCTPFDVTITPTSSGATSYSWDFGNGTDTKITSTPFNVTYNNTSTAPVTYTVKMTATNAGGVCAADAATATVVVDPQVVADGAFTITNACQGTVTFRNTSAGSTKYTWDFGDGQSSSATSAADVVHTYENRTSASVTYEATLTAENAKGCKSQKKFAVTIVPRVESSFTYSVVDKCTPMRINLVNTSLNGTEFTWDYGYSLGGVKQEDAKVSKAAFDKVIDNEDPDNEKKYTITLTTIDKVSGCSAVSTKDITVYPRIVPLFNVTEVNKCGGELSFENVTTGAIRYTWNFGDGSSSYTTTTATPVSHVFTNRDATSKTYTVTLVATNAIGCTKSFSKDVTIVPQVKSDFTLEELDACTPERVKFTNTSLNGTEYTWDYGYTLGGVHQKDVKTDKLPFDKVIDSESASTIQNYKIKLIALDKTTSCSDTSTKMLAVYPRVIPSFTLDKSSGCSELPVSVTNTSTGGTLAYTWTFGDGESATTSTLADPVSHTYVNRTSASRTYNLVLTATNAKGCSSSFSRSVIVHPKVEAAFTFVQPSKCTPFPIDITNASLNGTQYSWDFGHTYNSVARDTVTNSKAGFRTYIYNQGSSAQTYTLRLIARDVATGCVDTVKRTVTAQPVVKSLFGTDVDKGCNPLTVSFTNSSTGSSSYNWVFGNGLSSSKQVPDPVVFTSTDPINTTKYNITLTAINGDGCTNTSTKVIEVNPLLVAGFNIDKTTGCSPFDVAITPTSTGATSYSWDYGDGRTETRTSSTPFTVTYDNVTAASSTYTIKMVASNSAGVCQATAPSATVVVDPRVVANGAFTIVDKCLGQVSFTNTSTGSLKYTWDFGDGQSFNTTSLSAITHTYENRTGAAKIYTVTLTAENANGCKSVKTLSVTIVPRVESAFTYDVVEKCTPMKINIITSSLNGTEYQWDYGYTLGGVAQAEIRTSNVPFDKTIDNEDPNKILTYTIKLTTVDKTTGCSAIAAKDITVYPRIVPVYSTTIDDKCQGTVSFHNTTTGASTYTWVYGDQSSAYTTDKLETVTHTYLNRTGADALYQASLTASNAIGCSAVLKKDITIVPRVESEFTMDELDICTPVRVKLTNTSLNGHQFTWDYGYTLGGVAQRDVKTDRLPFEKIIDSESTNTIQTYPITLSVVDNNTGCSSVFTRNLEVQPRVVPSFTADKTKGCSDLGVTLTNTSTGGVLSYSWDFKDGESVKTTDLATSVSHTYVNRTSSTVTYNLQLTATNSKGCSASYNLPISVYPKVEAAFAFVQPSKCTPFPIDITNGSLNGNEYSWDFGHSVNGVNRDTVTINKNGFRTYIYNSNPSTAQTYTIKLVARDKVTGCYSEVTKTIQAQPEVKSLFNVDVDKGCNPLTVSFSNSSTGSNSYVWDFGNKTTSTAAIPSSVVYTNNDTVKVASYTIALTAKNLDGCTNVSTRRVDVYPKIMADISLDKVEGCTPLAVKVTNVYPSSSYRYEWSLGSNGTNSSQQIPSLNYINSTADYSVQTEVVKLKVYYMGDATCYKEVSKNISVYPTTRSDFDMDVTEACNPLVVNFTNRSKSFNSSTSYSWNFGNLGSSALKDPSYTFYNLTNTQTQSYDVKLKSISVHGCKDSITKTVVVRPVPRAQIAINTSSGCAPFNVDVQNLSIGSNPVYYYWLDNDRANEIVRNGTSNVQFAIDNLASATKETVVWHKIVSDFGCKDSVSQKVYTFPHVKALFTYSPSDNGCSPLGVNFTNTSQNSDYYTWDFDDGVTAHVTSPSHLFYNFEERDKTFNVRLTSTSEFGCENSTSKQFTVYSSPKVFFTIDPPLRVYPDAAFIFTNKTQPVAPSFNYEWTFGDGGTYIGMNPPVYTYKTWAPDSDENRYYVKLKVSNGNCKDEMTQFLYLKPAVPVSEFTTSVSHSCAPLVTQFTHHALYYKSIEWDFGDGTTSTEDSPTHTYPNPGKYFVRLAVHGDGGVTYSYTTLDVYPNPIASFKLAPAEAMLPDAKVHFYNTSTVGATYYWDFGDGIGVSTEKSPEYIYKNLGAYDVRLTATSENGCVDDTLVSAGVKVIGEGMIKFPNAFIPNTTGGNGGAYDTPDYKNEVFHPVSAGIVTYRLLIYNRWGEKLYESNDLNTGWDGYYKGKLCEQGVYVYRASGRYTNGKTFDVRGDVTLLR